MDLLQRIQRWYLINCNGDWEHSYGISITTLDNPGWWVKIDLQETCLEKAELTQQSTVERSFTNWVSWHIKNQQFVAFGGPENLDEILSYFLNEVLPQQGDPKFKYRVCIPLRDYPGSIWRLANASIVNECQLKILSFFPPEDSASYIIHDENSFKPFEELKATSLADAVAVAKPGDIITVTIEEHLFSTNLGYTDTVLG
ncbi:immunity 53 family protein [Hymenobacter sp. BT635]|uniref:Immunity 53 family protein n=2 Tax=Hymenobacter nitidus TaxID=2880929 RepID=A0ABS8ACV3_9BACT|nr:immunity 53 family protein [Hymenobacter nitidus]MCB2377767.1 immunity 53 family protein [Hymenobacter nitidus]